MHERYHRALDALARRGRRRALRAAAGLDFASNDYLGLSRSPVLRDAVGAALSRGVAVGAGASRLLRGNDPEHEALEAEAAAFFDAPQCLYLGGGYVANFALFSVLPQRGDLVVYDELIHASAHEGMMAGRADTRKATHNDASAFDDAIKAWRDAGGTGTPFIAVESLYSMDGDRAPLADLLTIARRHDAYLLIDEAHATGVFGDRGRGLAADLATRDDDKERIITLHTCGKALGAHGALIGAPKVLCAFLINRARAFIYATGPSPLMAAALRTSLRLLQEEDLTARLAQRIAFANNELETRCGIAGSGSQILPVILGRDARAMDLSAAMQGKGFDVRGIRPPTVPDGTARLRISITLNVSDAEIAQMLDALAAELGRSPLPGT